MLKKKEIEELLETKRYWFNLWIKGECWETAGQSKREVDILEQILEINKND